MSARRRLAALALALLPAASAPPSAQAGEARSFDCVLAEGEAYSFEAKRFTRADVKPLSIRITDVVAGSQTATLASENGKAGLKVVQALGALHFLEVAVEGYLVITTIYETPNAEGRLAAVHSRHLAVIGEPFVAQYRGSCTAGD